MFRRLDARPAGRPAYASSELYKLRNYPGPRPAIYLAASLVGYTARRTRGVRRRLSGRHLMAQYFGTDRGADGRRGHNPSPSAVDARSSIRSTLEKFATKSRAIDGDWQFTSIESSNERSTKQTIIIPSGGNFSEKLIQFCQTRTKHVAIPRILHFKQCASLGYMDGTLFRD